VDCLIVLFCLFELQGEDCAIITVAVDSYEINNSSGVELVAPVSVKHTVCWYSANGQARAQFTFNAGATCKTGTGEHSFASVFSQLHMPMS